MDNKRNVVIAAVPSPNVETSEDDVIRRSADERFRIGGRI